MQERDARSALLTVLTTEHYNLQSQRIATIGEANGRASIFLGAVSAGLIALGFAFGAGRSSAEVISYAVVVLGALAFLGVVTMARCQQSSMDDVALAARIDRIRAAYASTVPESASLEEEIRGAEGAFRGIGLRRDMQMLLTVAGSVSVVTALLVGGCAALAVFGVVRSLAESLIVGFVVFTSAEVASVLLQKNGWKRFNAAEITRDCGAARERR